ncbi:MAG: FprA family A-type flavoprotein [Chitinispirillia bacterium]|nr:FprA family A-type flavoprotein [Chitinispirillia bacterium]
MNGFCSFLIFMFKPRAIKDNLFWFGTVHWDKEIRRSLSPLQNGSSNNCYFVRGSDANALINTLPASCEEAFLEQFRGIDSIEYVIIENASNESAGMLPDILALYEKSVVICTEQCAVNLGESFHIDSSRIRTVYSGEMLSLGGKTLAFIEPPAIPWPGSMCTFLQEERTLFSGSLFSAHFASSELYAYDRVRLYPAAKQFFAENYLPFLMILNSFIHKIESLEPAIIAPSHGPLHYDPPFIINAYKNWAQGCPKNFAVLPYVSIHGSTKRMIEYLAGELAGFNIPVEPINMAQHNESALATALLDAGTIVFGSPTIHANPHPAIVKTAAFVNALKPKTLCCAIIGSYGFNSMMPEFLADQLKQFEAVHLEPFLCRGFPKDKDYAALDRIAEEIAEVHVGENLDIRN